MKRKNERKRQSFERSQVSFEIHVRLITTFPYLKISREIKNKFCFKVENQ